MQRGFDNQHPNNYQTAMIATKPDVAPDGLYTIAEVAKALQVHRRTIERYQADGRLKFRVRKLDNRKVTTGAWIINCWQDMYL